MTIDPQQHETKVGARLPCPHRIFCKLALLCDVILVSTLNIIHLKIPATSSAMEPSRADIHATEHVTRTGVVIQGISGQMLHPPDSSGK